MDSAPAEADSPAVAAKSPEKQPAAAPVESGSDTSVLDVQSKLSSWAKSLKIPQPLATTGDESPTGGAKSTFSRITSGLGLRTSPKSPPAEDSSPESSATSGLFGTITKGLVDTSKNAVKAVQVKARHAVSQNKRRYQEGEFDLDMTYITENIIAMGFPAGDMSSGFFGYVEGFYRNHMEEVIKFFETYHKGKYKVYNLCLERLYDASLFEGKVASFPFDDHNCPPIQLITSFCHSAYAWLKEDIENVVVVHCKAGMARTGLMISSLLLYLKRYVKYFERILTYFNGENQPGRKCMLRGFRLHRCPYWIRPAITISDHNGILFTTKKHPRTKDLSPDDYWFSAPKKGVMVFALPGEPGLTEVAGDFKVQFHDRQGDFYMFRKLPSPGFQVEVVLVDANATVPASLNTPTQKSDGGSSTAETATSAPSTADAKQSKDSPSGDKDDVFSDGEADDSVSPKRKGGAEPVPPQTEGSLPVADSKTSTKNDQAASNLTKSTSQLSLGNAASQPVAVADQPKGNAPVAAAAATNTESEFKAMAADASVFTFGDDDDYESE
ncbi:Phosphatidylinositol 3,4,5-trisphosphate 3-phosphatase and protein-tyrosine-phosphatase PTEN2A [Linum perenne]